MYKNRSNSICTEKVKHNLLKAIAKYFLEKPIISYLSAPQNFKGPGVFAVVIQLIQEY